MLGSSYSECALMCGMIKDVALQYDLQAKHLYHDGEEISVHVRLVKRICGKCHFLQYLFLTRTT